MGRRTVGAMLGLAAGAVAVATTVLCGAGTVGRALWSRPGHRSGVAVDNAADAHALPRRAPIKVLCWNVQFAAGRDQVFFYDGGEAVSVDEATVYRTIDRLVDVIERVDPDIVLLQEVDRGSRRTHHIDQHAELARRLSYASAVSTPYHRNLYVPHPPHEHLGAVDMHLSVFSRYRISEAVRWQLPLLDESWIRRQFNLRRALLEVDVPLVDGGNLRLFNTHLSAFSRGDGTVTRQVEAIDSKLLAATESGVPWVLAGDFNALPPGDDPSRLGETGALYDADNTPVQALFDRWASAIPAEVHRNAPAPWRTWLPPHRDRADRAIDHVFAGPGVEAHSFSVLSDVPDVSDHLPLVYTFEVH